MTQQDPDRGSGDRGHWREYRLGGLAEGAHVVGGVVVACAVGLVASFAALLLIGIAGEEELVVGFTDFIDELTQASLSALLGLALGCWGLFAVADSLRSVGVSRALVRAAEEDADPRAVPHPAQVEAVVVAPHLRLVVFLGLAGAMALLVAGVYISEHDAGVVLIGALIAAASAAGIAAAYVVSRPAHARRRHRIAEHWTAHYEQTAWGHARNASGSRRGLPSADGLSETSGKLGRGLSLMFGGTVLGMLSATVLELFLFVRYPGSVSTPGATLNERGYFSRGMEAVLDGALWVVVALGLVGMLVVVVGSVVAATGLADEREALVQQLDDPTASRPSASLLARHAGRRPPWLALIGAGVGSFVLVPSLGLLALLSKEPTRYSDTAELFSGLLPFAVGGVAVGVLLIVAALVSNAVVILRGYPLRDRLQQRWPVLPGTPDDKDTVKYAVRTKPTLRRKDIGIW